MTLTFAAVAAAGCDDYEIGYCNVLVGSHHWGIHAGDCSPVSRHSYGTNAAHYDGAGMIAVCEEIYDASNGGAYSYECGANDVYGYTSWCNTGTLTYVDVYNGDNNNHTVRGSASY